MAENKESTTTLDPSATAQFVTDEKGNKRLVYTTSRELITKDKKQKVNTEYDDKGNEIQYKHVVKYEKVLASDTNDAGSTLTTDEFTFADVDIDSHNTKTQPSNKSNDTSNEANTDDTGVYKNSIADHVKKLVENSTTREPLAANTKLDKTAASTVNDDYDMFANANIDNRTLQTSYDDPAISKYIEDLSEKTAINHIFSNTFYRIPAVPHWAYSVDFIPTAELIDSFKNYNAYAISKVFTQAVISLTLPAREMTSTVSNYKGLSVELPARAKTSGELSFVFAENETFTISNTLEQLLKYARNDMFYEFDNSIIMNYLSNSNNADVQQYANNIDLLNATIASYRKFLDNYAHQFNILVKLYRAADAKAFGDTNKNEFPTFVYFFKDCDVASIKQFKLDYNSDKPIDINASFMYQYFEEMTYEEYLLRYGGWNDGLDNPMFEASQEEMIAAVEASNPIKLVTHRHVYGVDLERS